MEFKLLGMRIFNGLDKHIKATRKWVLPTEAKLMKLRHKAESAGIHQIEYEKLTIELEGLHDSFWLEHGSTGVRVGRVGIDSRTNYRVLWLIDGRTVEVVYDRKTDNAVLFFNGEFTGLLMAQKHEKFLKVLSVCVSWKILINDTEIFRIHFNDKTMREMSLIHHRAPDVIARVGQPSQAGLADYLRSISHRLINSTPPTNDRWFLPRSEGELPCRNDSEVLALMAFALVFRQAYWSVD
ncbi:MAG: hypothetical protein KDA29_00595 [Phycisphaerales bacterium]|nr:hypothetical protein [Phycisphaerales bacterium]